MSTLYFNDKEVWISTHAIIRARERQIAYPDQVYNTILAGKCTRFGKNNIKFIKKTKDGSII